MTYRPMRFDPAYRPFVAAETIYLLPLSSDPPRYRILCPSSLRKKLIDLAIQEKLSIRYYSGCPVEAAVAVREQLARICRREADRYGGRLNNLAMAGIVLAVLGAVNWVFPDPIPLADELLLTAGGAAMAYAAHSRRRKSLPALRQKVTIAEQRLGSLVPTEDRLLTRIFLAIQARTSPERSGRQVQAIDPLEAESAWLVEHLDLRSVLDRGNTSVAELRKLVQVLEDTMPFRRIAALEWRLRSRPADRRSRAAADRLAARLGMSRDALTVYGEFHRIAAEILQE